MQDSVLQSAKNKIVGEFRSIFPKEEKRAKFWTHFHKSDCVIAGSMVVHALLKDPDWEPNDIDIWINMTSDYDTLKKMFLDEGYKQQYVHPAIAYVRLATMVAHIYMLTKKGARTVQIIITRFSPLEVIDTFDIFATQFVFELKAVNTTGMRANIRAVHEQATADLLEKRITICETSGDIQSIREWIRTLDRIQKYVSRGFHISDKEIHKIVDYVNGFTYEDIPNAEVIYERLLNYFFYLGYCFSLDRIKNKIDVSTHCRDFPTAITTASTNCFNFITLEDEALATIDAANRRLPREIENAHHVTIVVFGSSEPLSGTQFQLSTFADLKKDPSNVFYACQGRQHIPHQQFVRIPTCSGQVYIKMANFRRCVHTVYDSFMGPPTQEIKWIFGVSKTETRVMTSASQTTVNAWRGRGSIVSAHHCQDNTDFYVHQLHYVRYVPRVSAPETTIIKMFKEQSPDGLFFSNKLITRAISRCITNKACVAKYLKTNGVRVAGKVYLEKNELQKLTDEENAYFETAIRRTQNPPARFTIINDHI